MTNISSVDHVMMILRQRLGERKNAARGGRGTASTGQAIDGRATVAALAAIRGIDERQLRKTLIQALLAEQLGHALINDARFQEVVTQVSDTLEDDPDGRALMDRLLLSLKGGG